MADAFGRFGSLFFPAQTGIYGRGFVRYRTLFHFAATRMVSVGAGECERCALACVVGMCGNRLFYRPQCRKRERKIQSETDFTTRQHHSGDGFVRSDNVFGGVKQVVLDEVFKGAEIRNSFGGTVLDLRRTNIEQGETYIDVECNFGGVEIYVPLDWRVDLQANAFLGGCEDKRVPGVNIDQSRRLVVIGNVSFGGVEIKG